MPIKLNVQEYVDNQYEEIKKNKKRKAIKTAFLGTGSIPKTLYIYQIGDNPASNRYINNKIKKCEMLGIKYKHIKYDKEIKKDVVRKDISKILGDPNKKIIVQEPTPWKNRIKIHYNQDVDGTSVHTKKMRTYNSIHTYEPATARGIYEYMKHIDQHLEGKKVLIINRSELVGERLRELLLNENMLVEVAHSHISKQRIIQEMQTSDYIISGVGIPGFFSGDDVPEHATFIDVSINFDENGKMCGDLNINKDCTREFRYTPVPGGVGQLTVLSLMKNILEIPIKKSL